MGLGPLHYAQTGEAGCPGVGPDVRAFTRGRMSGLEALALLLSGSVVFGYPGLRSDGCPGWGCMSGPCRLGRWLLACNAPRPMCQVSSNFLLLLPCHCLHVMHCISCHHVHFICIRVRLMHLSIFPVVRFTIRHSHMHPAHPSEWAEICQVALVHHQ